jgi:aspartate dehydrogenase
MMIECCDTPAFRLSTAGRDTVTIADKPERIAIIGYGAIGGRVYSSLRASLPASVAFAVLVRNERAGLEASLGETQLFHRLDELLQWKPTLAVECAAHRAVASIVPPLLRAGTDVILASIGALADEELGQALSAAAREGKARLILISGGVGGLDALKAASGAGLETVTYIGRKPPLSWAGSPAESRFDLASISAPTTVFSGNAAEAARLYPKNANVAATIALAGVGFEKTRVELIADPTVTQNISELRAVGSFGSLSLRIENNPLPENPRTSMLAALSIEAKVRMRFDHIAL